MPSPNQGSGARGTHSGTGGNGLSEAGQARVAEIQRARLLGAMVEMVVEHGLADATVARVVGQAGVSRRTFYELFEDREECFLAALDDAIARVSDEVVPAYESGDGWAERLRLALVALLSFLDVERGLGQLLVVESLGAGARALERRRRVLAQTIGAVDAGREGMKGGSELPSLTAEGIVGGALSVIHARMVADGRRVSAHLHDGAGSPRMGELVNPLMSMIVLPYLGPAAARRELRAAAQSSPAGRRAPASAPLEQLGMRLTYRTVRVLLAVGARPGASNREVGEASGATDQGQISKLLARLERLGLVHNEGLGPAKGSPNAWALTAKGALLEQAMSAHTSLGGGR
jgi:AcrR family transcriptional regulator